MQVWWLDPALDAVAEIEAYVAEGGGAEVANRVVARLFDRSEQIGWFPHSGRSVPEGQFLNTATDMFARYLKAPIASSMRSASTASKW